MTLDTTLHYFSLKQLAFLHRGPTYVTPCLLSSSSSSIFPRNEILTQQMKPLQQQLTKLFTTYKVDLSRRWNFEQEIQKQFMRSFSIPIPTYIQQRTHEEKQLIQTISNQIKRNNLILRRTADEQNTYYLGQLDEFYRMTNDYFENLTCYEFISTIDETNNTEQQQLNEMLDSIEFKLNKLLQDRIITKDHLDKIQIDTKKTNITLPYLYFLPNIHKNGHISIETRFSSMNHCPMESLATYLDQLLRPLFITFSLSTTIINGNDFIEKLQHYCSQGDNLLPLTKFITFQIHNLSTRVSFNDILTGVNRFLHFSMIEGHYQRLNIDTIEYLIALVLQNNVFTYQKKIYRHIKGCPLNLSITELLFNIYLQYWQLPLVRLVRLKNIFYGRYHNMGFLTWDGPMDDFDSCIAELNTNHPDIQLTISSSLHVHFLNIDIENRKGNLYTRVYHDPNQQPFLLPYVTDHPRLYHRRWFRFALLRAGQYCCSWNDFNEERLYIELTFLANGYSLEFVEYHLRQFFIRFNPIEKRMNLNQRTYPTFRTKLFQYIKEQKQTLQEQEKLKQTLQEQEKLKQHHPLIQLYYLYDWGLRYEFNQKFYELWSTLIENDPFFKKFNLKIQLHTKHCYPSNILFLHNNKE